jgi:hypothetical protein
MVEAMLQSHSAMGVPVQTGVAGVPHIGVNTRSFPVPDPLSCTANPPLAVTRIAPALTTGAEALLVPVEPQPASALVGGIALFAW